ncbi:hypothetical protein AFLA_007402 [Aspergillus flavus NRRL3357]|nr:hypothetical protein AFLA_007402 [Aspergillus flavus NRRL3357]
MGGGVGMISCRCPVLNLLDPPDKNAKPPTIVLLLRGAWFYLCDSIFGCVQQGNRTGRALWQLARLAHRDAEFLVSYPNFGQAPSARVTLDTASSHRKSPSHRVTGPFSRDALTG